jgi:phage terminase Nu1 subunit (DNA packaging protein)
MSAGLTRAQLAKALGVSARTVTTWVSEGCPCTRQGTRDLFDEAAVRAWRAERQRGAQGATAGTTDGLDPQLPSRDSLVRAELVRKLTIARKNEMELAAEKGLKDLDLGARIRAAKTHDDMLTISSEVCALVGTGSLSPARGRTIQGLLAEMRHSLKQHRDNEVDEDAEHFVPLTEEGVQLVSDFEAIVSDERRVQVLEHVRGQRALDEAETPNVDLADEPAAESTGPTEGT